MTRRPTHRRPGMISFVSVFVIFTFLILFSVVWNCSRLTHRKVEAQNAADASGQAMGLQQARAMNTITAINHLLGELNAVDVLAYTPSGMELEEGTGISLADSQPMLTLAFDDAMAYQYLGPTLKPNTEVKLKASTLHSDSGGAIGDSRRRLKKVLTWAYAVYAAGVIMANERDLGATYQQAGELLIRAGRNTQDVVEFEWDLLDAMEKIAKEKLLPLKWLCNATLIPELYKHCRRVVERTPERAEAAATLVAERHGMSGSLFPNTSANSRYPLELPVVPEKQMAESAGWEKSQMVRATTPWVQYWRKPILAFAEEYLYLSKYADHFLDWSNFYTVHMSRWAGEDYGTYLYILKDLDYGGADKGREPWVKREGSERADELFATIAFAHRPAPDLLGRPIFRQSQPDGIAAFTQVLIYNANPQEPEHRWPKRDPDEWQRRVGWDTLNWHPDVAVPEFRYGKNKDRDNLVVQPQVQVNWHIKPVPVTRLKDAAGSQTDALNRILGRTTADSWLSNTH